MVSEKVDSIIARHGFWICLLISYGAILLNFTGLWQLCIIPPVIGGFFIKKKASIAWWAGFLGVLVAWLTLLLYFISTQPALELADLLMEIIIGSPGLGIVGMVLTLVIGGCLGGFGALIGFSVMQVLQKSDTRPEE